MAAAGRGAPGSRAIAGVVAERAFVAQRLGRVNVAFDDEVGGGGDFEVVGLALEEFDGFFAEVTGEEKFVEAVGQWRGGGGGWKCSGTPAGNCARSNPNSPVQNFVAYATEVRHGRGRERMDATALRVGRFGGR